MFNHTRNIPNDYLIRLKAKNYNLETWQCNIPMFINDNSMSSDQSTLKEIIEMNIEDDVYPNLIFIYKNWVFYQIASSQEFFMFTNRWTDTFFTIDECEAYIDSECGD